jgi:hypothetical protein
MIKILNLFLIVILFLSFYSLPKIYAQKPQIILIPIERVTFSPQRNEFEKPGLKDFSVSVGNYEPVQDGALCRFTFRQVNERSDLNNPEILKDFSQDSRYVSRTCAGLLPASEQISNSMILVIEITNPGGQKIGTYINYFTNQDTPIAIVDPNEYAIPRELYTPPEINVIIDKTDLVVGDNIRGQVEIINRDDFVLKGFELKSTIQEKRGRIACDSLNYGGEKLNGSIIWLPSVKTFAQEIDEANCVEDEYAFEAKLASLTPSQATRLNFNLSIEQEGELKFDILTNLDQAGVSRTTQPLKISPKSNENQVSPWVYWFVAIVSIILLGISAYYGKKMYIRRKKESKNLK